MATASMGMDALDRRELQAQVRKACRYMRDDRAVASVFGVSVEFVREERAKLPVVISTDDDGIIGAEAERLWKINCVQSNAAFMRAILSAATKRSTPGLEGHTPEMFAAKCAEYGVAA